MTIRTVNYVTSNSHKVEENEIFASAGELGGQPIRSMFDFRIRSAVMTETLETDLEAMVIAEVAAAYHQLKVPCFVEHAGLIFDDYASDSYPGGLTKPMWNALKHHFINETKSAGRGAVARAAIAYCDGMTVKVFTGETHGTIASEPRGSRNFYWDTIFCPDGLETAGMTYAEIIDDSRFGLSYKVLKLSQSTKAKLKMLDYLRLNPPALWQGVQ